MKIALQLKSFTDRLKKKYVLKNEYSTNIDSYTDNNSKKYSSPLAIDKFTTLKTRSEKGITIGVRADGRLFIVLKHKNLMRLTSIKEMEETLLKNNDMGSFCHDMNDDKIGEWFPYVHNADLHYIWQELNKHKLEDLEANLKEAFEKRDKITKSLLTFKKNSFKNTIDLHKTMKELCDLEEQKENVSTSEEYDNVQAKINEVRVKVANLKNLTESSSDYKNIFFTYKELEQLNANIEILSKERNLLKNYKEKNISKAILKAIASGKHPLSLMG